MQCPECGERMTGSYDGGEANDYALVVPKCNCCGYIDWDSADELDPDEDDESDDESELTGFYGFWTRYHSKARGR